MKNLVDESKRLADYVINTSTGFSGLLMDKVDIRENVAQGNCMINDLGDYVPFFYWLGIKSDRKYLDWAGNQVKMAIKCCRMPNNFFDFSLAKEANKPLKKTNFKLIKISEHGDTILGLVTMYELSGNLEFKKYAEDFFDALEKYAISKNGFINSHVYPALALKIPLSAGNYSGLFIEELCRFYKLTNDEKYLNIALRIAKGWINTQFFKKHGLFSFEVLSPSPITKSVMARLFNIVTSLDIDMAMTVKSNVNIVYGLMELYSIKKEDWLREAILKWFESLQGKLKESGERFYSYWHPKSGGGGITLETNHAVIDVLIEGYLQFRQADFLTQAEKCANSWVAIQSSCGLVPCGVGDYVPLFDMSGNKPKKIYLDPSISILDGQTDFSIVLLKLDTLIHKPMYKQAAMRILDGIFKKHRFLDGYAKFVDTRTHEKSGFIIETKFLTLLLKLFLLHVELNENKNPIENRIIKGLIRDR